jgi:urea transport system permease protein
MTQEILMSTWRIVGYYLALLVMIAPWQAQAADADDFVAANRTQQARLLEQWAAAPTHSGCRCCGR